MKLQHVMDLDGRLLDPWLDAGPGPFGARYIYRAADGTFEGPELRGKVLPGGGDWPLATPDGTMRLDIRLTLETDDGALIYFANQGVWRSDPDRPAPDATRLADFGDMYIMATPRFETGDDRYRWLNDFVYVAEGKADMLADEGFLARVTWRIYRVVSD